MLKLDFYQRKNEHRKKVLDKLSFSTSANTNLEFHYNDENVQKKAENLIINFLSDPVNDLPIYSFILFNHINSQLEENLSDDILTKIVKKISTVHKIIKIEEKKNIEEEKYFRIIEIDTIALNAYMKKILKRKFIDTSEFQIDKIKKPKTNKNLITEKIENLLASPLVSEYEPRILAHEINELLGKLTTVEKLELEHFKSAKSHVQEYCPNGTKIDCCRDLIERGMIQKKCDKIHFKRIIKPHTDISLGDCSFLNTCYNMNNCKYIHYEVDMQDVDQELLTNSSSTLSRLSKIKIPPQWIQCDLRTFDMTILGKFSVIMADPPWDIHMELPYGTMADDEMKKLDVPSLQDDGYIFLWVTGRAMELGRECLKEWNYERCDELIWVKTNQLQRIIRTGRTGHWLNHGKEHCLIGVKGKPNPELFNIGLDCDTIVAEVRATSHKPDEIYGLIERLSPGTRKCELFGRPHNLRENWITLGNQLDGVRLLEPDLVKKFKAKYPNGNPMPQLSTSASN